MRRTKLFLFICFVLISSGCSHKDRGQTVLASVDGQHIFLNKFIIKYKDFLDLTGVEDNLLLRTNFLDSEIDRKILLAIADSLDFANLPLVQKRMQVARDRVLLNEYFERELKNKIHIPDSLIRDAFTKSKTQIHARHLYSRTMESANQLFERLMIGESFEKLAKEVFADPLLANNGGDLGYFTFDDMDPAFEAVAFTLKDGEISTPVKTKNGYSIIQVIDRWIEPLITEKDYQIHKDDFKRILRSRATPNRIMEFTDSLSAIVKISLPEKEIVRLFDSWYEMMKRHENGLEASMEDLLLHILGASSSQLERVHTLLDLKELLLGLEVRKQIIEITQDYNWYEDPDMQNAMETEEERILISRVLDEILQFKDGSFDGRAQYLHSIRTIRESRKISIQDNLLREFILS